MAHASDAVTKDFPTPPFPLTTPITFFTFEDGFIGSFAIPFPPFALLGQPSQLSLLQLKTTQTNATIPFVLDGQVLEDNLHWCGKNHAWLERTAEANTVLISEILLLVGNETEDYFLLKKESRHSGSSRKKDA